MLRKVKYMEIRSVRPPRSMRLACTGFVSVEAGSMAAANALLLASLLDRGFEIDFFSKPAFVDPRPAVGARSGFEFRPVVNRISDNFRWFSANVLVLGFIAGRNDAYNYNRLLMRRIRQNHRVRGYDAVLWLGDYAHGSVEGVPTISFAQGAPGSDARSILRRHGEIRRLAGWGTALRWESLARLRLSRLGLPRFANSDHIIVGSKFSRQALVSLYKLSPECISTLPYPVDLDLFKPKLTEHIRKDGPLHLLWLGRIVPRKRLDVFLDGLAIALQRGVDVSATIVGRIGFVKGYEKMIRSFPYPARLQWLESVSRADVPDLLRTHDVLAQPSEDEDFGSSVAEAQSCGLPVIVGHRHGNADYLCSRDIKLRDDRPDGFAAALGELALRRDTEEKDRSSLSRRLAEEQFGIRSVGARLATILETVHQEWSLRGSAPRGCQ